MRNLDRILAAYVRPRTAIPFAAPDGQPVSDFLVLLVSKQAAEEHLEILAEAARLFDDRSFRDRLRQCGDSAAVRKLFEGSLASP